MTACSHMVEIKAGRPAPSIIRRRSSAQGNKEKLAAHHDALEFSDGRTVLLTLLREGQAASVLQLPAQPKTEAEAREHERVGFIG